MTVRWEGRGGRAAGGGVEEVVGTASAEWVVRFRDGATWGIIHVEYSMPCHVEVVEGRYGPGEPPVACVLVGEGGRGDDTAHA